MKHRIVENYQLSESSSYNEDGIDIYLAHHAISKLPYLLKKINVKNSDRAKYQTLINQINILKLLSSPSIVQCHKMLRTSNHYYIVYDYCDGSPLPQALSLHSKEQRISILLQLIQALKVMANASVVHCNLQSSSIIVSSDNRIKIMNFTYGHNRNNKKSVPVKFKPPASAYLAPEINRDGIVHEKSDYYSLGVIMAEMSITQNSKLSVEKHSINYELTQIIQQLQSADPTTRPELKQVEAALKQSSGYHSPRKSREQSGEENNSLKKTNSMKSNKSDQSSKKIIVPIPTQTKESNEKQRRFVQQILKRRNFAIFLLEMSEACLRLQDEQLKLGIFLSYLLMKKSCIVIYGLLGYLKGDKQYEKQIDKTILDKSERASFEKKPDFFKLISTIQKQSDNQKRWLQDIYRNIAPELPEKWKQIAAEETINDNTLHTFIVDFLHETIERNEDIVPDKFMESLYLMSEIIPHRTFEKLFQEMILEQKTNLEQQHLYIHVRKMKKKQLLSQIKARIKSQL